MTDQAYRAAEAAARDGYGKLIAFLVSRTRDLAGAEDALSDAFAAALTEWPRSGVPRDPRAWLAAVARRKQTDQLRRRRTRVDAAPHLALLSEESVSAHPADGEIQDERLALLFVCAHPAIDPAIRAPLMLRTVMGLETGTIASAFLTAPAAMAHRLVRAQARIASAGIPFRVPEEDERPARLGAVLDAIYAAFGAGWTDPAGTDARRRDLAVEAIFLGRLLVSLMPASPEALGLLSLMLHAEARRPARRDRSGAYVPLAEQDPASWDGQAIDEAEVLLRRAGAMGQVGRFQLEAAVQSAHAARRVTGLTDWRAIERLYDALAAMTGSPVAAINRAVALAETTGPLDGLAVLDSMAADMRLVAYQPYWAARAGLLARADRAGEADEAYRRAIGLEPDPAVRRFLTDKRAPLPMPVKPSPESVPPGTPRPARGGL